MGKNSEPVKEDEISEVYTDPDSYKGRTITIKGKVFTNIEKDSDYIYFQMYGDPENNDLNTVVYYKDKDLDIEQDDYIELTGVIVGKFDGKNAFGGSVKAIKISATSIKKIDAASALAPAIKIIEPGLEVNQSGYVMKIYKVEFAENETRVYVTFSNQTDAKYHIYTYSSKIIQNGKQYDYEYNYNYEGMTSEILPGVLSEGVLVFPKIDIGEFRVIVDGSSSNYKLDTDPFDFNIVID